MKIGSIPKQYENFIYGRLIKWYNENLISFFPWFDSKIAHQFLKHSQKAKTVEVILIYY